jgi:hypothetical protein
MDNELRKLSSAAPVAFADRADPIALTNLANLSDLADFASVLADHTAVVAPAKNNKKIPKVKLSPPVARAAEMLYRQFNLDDENDGKDYAVEVVDTFYVGKKRVSLIHFVGYHPRWYARIIPTAQLRKLCA